MILSVGRYLAFSLLLYFTATPHCLAQSLPPLTFDGAEHITAGEQVKLNFDSKENPEDNHQFQLPNGLTMTYGELVSFGDYYGVPNEPISKGRTPLERKKRFIAAFNTFATNESAFDEANKILDLLHQEKKLVEEAIARGEDPAEVSKVLVEENTRKLNCITGGGCSDMWFLKPGRYLELARVDYDHFSHNAWLSYQTGHELALEYAVMAHQTRDPKLLELAYMVNGFASHYLSDRFAAGHLRTPRVKLPQKLTPELLGSLLAGFMHIEDNAYGLHVFNKRGDRWTVYGDHGYHGARNKTNREILKLVLQMSADQVFSAYQTGVVPADVLPDLVPYPEETENNNNLDISPLFYYDEKSQQLLRRNDVSNPYDRHWTANWWAWSTLILLSKQYGIPPEVQGSLALSPLSEAARRDGLITDKNILLYLKTKK